MIMPSLVFGENKKFNNEHKKIFDILYIDVRIVTVFYILG
jgi:hypothetical protein